MKISKELLLADIMIEHYIIWDYNFATIFEAKLTLSVPFLSSWSTPFSQKCTDIFNMFPLVFEKRNIMVYELTTWFSVHSVRDIFSRWTSMITQILAPGIVLAEAERGELCEKSWFRKIFSALIFSSYIVYTEINEHVTTITIM